MRLSELPAYPQHTRCLEKIGLNNHEVLSNIEGVVEKIGAALEKLTKGSDR